MESFIPEVYEEIIGEVDIITLTSRQYCVIENPLGKTQWAKTCYLKKKAKFCVFVDSFGYLFLIIK
jgi:hypothetical protein